jgi:hypothetical protein
MFGLTVGLLASTAHAQIGNYLGPGMLTRGTGDIGTRSGEQVDIRFFANLSGVYDNSIRPLAVDKSGNLVKTQAFYGTEATLGALGVHQFKKSSLALDYRGTYRHYPSNPNYDGSDQSLALGYTWQASRRWSIDTRTSAGTYSIGTGSVVAATGARTLDVTSAITPTTLLFDNRTDFLQTSFYATYIQSARTSYTVGGTGYKVMRRSAGLSNVNGYDLIGSYNYRATKKTTLGVTYGYTHYDFPNFFGEADIHRINGTYAVGLGQRWTLAASGGIYYTMSIGIQSIAVDPAIAALLGTSTLQQAVYRQNILPSGSVTLNGHFQRSGVFATYSRTVTPGNGLYQASRSEGMSGGWSYTTPRHFNFGIDMSRYTLSGLNQSISGYSQFSVGGGMTYHITRVINLTARYDSRKQALGSSNFNNFGSRVSFGLAFSPGSIPLSLW